MVRKAGLILLISALAGFAAESKRRINLFQEDAETLHLLGTYIRLPFST
jgi:hypothetical protein